MMLHVGIQGQISAQVIAKAAETGVDQGIAQAAQAATEQLSSQRMIHTVPLVIRFDSIELMIEDYVPPLQRSKSMPDLGSSERPEKQVNYDDYSGLSIKGTTEDRMNELLKENLKSSQSSSGASSSWIPACEQVETTTVKTATNQKQPKSKSKKTKKNDDHEVLNNAMAKNKRIAEQLALAKQAEDASSFSGLIKSRAAGRTSTLSEEQKKRVSLLLYQRIKSLSDNTTDISEIDTIFAETQSNEAESSNSHPEALNETIENNRIEEQSKNAASSPIVRVTFHHPTTGTTKELEIPIEDHQATDTSKWDELSEYIGQMAFGRSPQLTPTTRKEFALLIQQKEVEEKNRPTTNTEEEIKILDQVYEVMREHIERCSHQWLNLKLKTITKNARTAKINNDGLFRFISDVQKGKWNFENIVKMYSQKVDILGCAGWDQIAERPAEGSEKSTKTVHIQKKG